MRALPLSVVHSDDLAEVFWHRGTADLSAGRGSPVSNFIQTPRSHRPRLIPRVVFPYGREFIMSMHQYMPDQAVLADSWTLFCPECAQKMRIIMAAPAQDGKETRTFECVSGHREWMTVALH
jgi:hypothetical protein